MSAQWILSALLVISSSAWAQTQLEFRSSYDRFTLEKQGRQFSLNGKAVNSESFDEFMGTLKQELVDPCDNVTGKPDLVMTLKEGEQTTSKSFYIGQHVIRGGSNCLFAQGEGIYYLPLHRSWFDPAAKASVNLGRRLVLELTDGTKVELEKTGNEWSTTNSTFYADMDFLDRFQESLKDFKVDVKLHPAVMKDKATFKMINDGKVYEFAKVGVNLWAMKRPGGKWLESSKSWSFWLDMVKTQWEDRYSNQVNFILDKKNSVSERIGGLQSLKSGWSGSIKRALHKILMDREEKTDLKLEALKLLKQKPTTDNFKAMIQALSVTEDRELLLSLTQSLRVRNPKGPVIETDADESTKASAIRQWQSWWREQKNP